MTRTPQTSINRKILEDVLAIPTAPFAEHRVMSHVELFCARRKHVTLTHDTAGNMLARVRKGTRRITRPVCVTAHLDHPGFVAQKMTGKGKLRAAWRGGVPKEYFVGSKVRFWIGEDTVRGHVRSVKIKKNDERKRVETALIDVTGPVPPGSIGMWDFPDSRIKGTRIYARGCDDLAGVGAMLSAIDELARGRGSCDAYFLFTRAEEVGFIGAIAAARRKTIPKKCYIVAMETSSELPHARMGDGPILRVGDRATSFTSEVTSFCFRVAQDLGATDSSFKYQRKLMDGGTCESSAFCTLGYDATGLCLALGNYHNVNRKRGVIGPEFIDLNDYDNAIKWFVELGRAPRPYTGRDDALIAQLKGLEKTHNPLLRSSRRRPR